MEKTLEMHLAGQRDRIYTAILDAPSPKPMSWEHKLLFEQARIVFAKAVLDSSDAIL
jgi:hypothetical protein